MKKHSQFIGHPIKLLSQEDKDEEIAGNKEEEEKDNDAERKTEDVARTETITSPRRRLSRKSTLWRRSVTRPGQTKPGPWN